MPTQRTGLLLFLLLAGAEVQMVGAKCDLAHHLRVSSVGAALLWPLWGAHGERRPVEDAPDGGASATSAGQEAAVSGPLQTDAPRADGGGGGGAAVAGGAAYAASTAEASALAVTPSGKLARRKHTSSLQAELSPALSELAGVAAGLQNSSRTGGLACDKAEWFVKEFLAKSPVFKYWMKRGIDVGNSAGVVKAVIGAGAHTVAGAVLGTCASIAAVISVLVNMVKAFYQIVCAKEKDWCQLWGSIVLVILGFLGVAIFLTMVLLAGPAAAVASATIGPMPLVSVLLAAFTRKIAIDFCSAKNSIGGYVERAKREWSPNWREVWLNFIGSFKSWAVRPKEVLEDIQEQAGDVPVGVAEAVTALAEVLPAYDEETAVSQTNGDIPTVIVEAAEDHIDKYEDAAREDTQAELQDNNVLVPNRQLTSEDLQRLQERYGDTEEGASTLKAKGCI